MSNQKTWETFCDESYYHMWRLRLKNERGFDDGYHINNGEEAQALCAMLNTMEQELADAREQRDRLRIIYGEIIASVRVNFMRGMFQQATQEQIDEWCEQQLSKISTKGGQP